MKKAYIEPRAKEVKFSMDNLLISGSLQGDGDSNKEVLSKDEFDPDKEIFGW